MLERLDLRFVVLEGGFHLLDVGLLFLRQFLVLLHRLLRARGRLLDDLHLVEQSANRAHIRLLHIALRLLEQSRSSIKQLALLLFVLGHVGRDEVGKAQECVCSVILKGREVHLQLSVFIGKSSKLLLLCLEIVLQRLHRVRESNELVLAATERVFRVVLLNLHLLQRFRQRINLLLQFTVRRLRCGGGIILRYLSFRLLLLWLRLTHISHDAQFGPTTPSARPH